MVLTFHVPPLARVYVTYKLYVISIVYIPEKLKKYQKIGSPATAKLHR